MGVCALGWCFNRPISSGIWLVDCRPAPVLSVPIASRRKLERGLTVSSISPGSQLQLLNFDACHKLEYIDLMLYDLTCLEPTIENLIHPPRRGAYVYFECPEFASYVGFRYANAAWAADASMFAYARMGLQRMDETEYRGILKTAGFDFAHIKLFGDCFVDDAKTARGFFAGSAHFAMLAFRGTESETSYDLLADLRLDFADNSAANGSRVHQGFQDCLDSIWADVTAAVEAYRKQYGTQEICITGHSLGAAIATLAFQRLQDPASSLCTFGCPRVGNHAFNLALAKTAETRGCYRIVDHQDVVTHVPTPLLRYTHPNCSLYWIDEFGNVSKIETELHDDLAAAARLCRDLIAGRITEPIPGPLADHSPVRYCHWIGRKATVTP